MKALALLPLFLVFLLPLRAQLDTFVVYPGDTNNDSIVNVRDLLPVGITYFQETLPRPAAAPDWAPQPAEGFDFANLPATGINFAHVDADGNGFIDSLDTELIAQHYDSTAAEVLPPPYQPAVPAEASYCPGIRLAFDRDTAQVGDTVFLEAFIEGFPNGGVTEPEGVLGAAFSVKYDPLNVKDSLTRVFPDTTTGDLMFVHATAQLAQTGRTALPPGRIDVGAAAYGSNALQQNRRLARFMIIVEDMIFRSSDTVVAPLIAEVIPSSILMLNREEQFFPPDCPVPMKDTLILLDPATATAAPPEDSPDWSIAPNPNNGCFQLIGNWQAARVTIFNPLGQAVYHSALTEPAIHCPDLPAGWYYLVLEGQFSRAAQLFQCHK